jgi:hypothetical protein
MKKILFVFFSFDAPIPQSLRTDNSEVKGVFFQGCGSGSGARGKKIKKFQWKNMHFLVILSLKR